MTLYSPLRIVLAVTALVVSVACLQAQQDGDQPGRPDLSTVGEGTVQGMQYPNAAIQTILLYYEALTGATVIRDANIQDQTISIITSSTMTEEEAADFIEKSFLLNGYALIPTERPNILKIIAYNTDKKLSSEGLPVFTTPFQLPQSEEVVTYIMPLSYLTPDAAAELFANIVELHPYGRITPLQNASALVITENAPVIRRLVELRDHLDVSPIKTVSESFQLERADAEEVVEALIDILELDQQAPSTSAPAQGGRAPAPATPVSTGGEGGASSLIPSQRGSASFAKATSPKPRVRAITRANRVLVVASPQDLEYIRDIITHLDAPVETASYMRRKLNYIAVTDVLQIASDVILRGLGGENAQGGQVSGTQNQDGNLGLGSQNNGSGNNNQFGDSNSSIGRSGSGRGGATGNLGNAGADQARPPQSIVIDKTLLVADNIQNLLIASGPPEHLRLINELLDEMDRRPSQIQISAVIAQLNLGDDFAFGIDFFRTLDNGANGSPPAVSGSLAGRPATSSLQSLIDLANFTDPSNFVPAATGLTLYGQINTYTDAVLSSLESTDRFKVLQRPTVYTVNNRQATIETGQRVAVPRSTLSSIDVDQSNNNQIVTSNIDYEDVVLRVDVLPLINSDGDITLQIQQKNDNIVGFDNVGNNQIPRIATQVLGTTVMVPNGGTVILGGLIGETDRRNQAGLPLFSNVPLLGRVFGSTVDNVDRQELLIFIQPRVIWSDCDYTQADQNMIDRTRSGPEAVQFSENRDNNIESFESQEFNSPEKRITFFRDLFNKSKKEKPEPSVRAVPIGE